MPIHYIIIVLVAVILGQIVNHLNKKLPPVVSEEIKYKEFFSTLKYDFKIDIKYSIILVLIAVALIYKSIEIGNLPIMFVYTYLIISSALLIAFSIDYRFQLIPDEVHIIILICGIFNLIYNHNYWYSYIVGALIGGGTFYLIGLISLFILKKEGMGLGDVKLMSALGFAFGIKNILVITLISFILGAIIGGTLLLLKKKDASGYIPFGPFIVIGAILVMFVPADYVIELYITFCSWLGMKMTDAIYFFIK